MMDMVVAGIAQFLHTAADPAVAAVRVGSATPATSSDLPCVVVSLVIDGTGGNGLGSFVKEGHQLTQNTGIVAVQHGPESFSADLKTLQLPLPLRKPEDVQVGLVTGPNQVKAYRTAASPAAADEFRVDPLRALVIFGAAQPQGQQLQVTSWTTIFRDDIRAARCNGTATLEVWTASAADLAGLSSQLQSKIFDDRTGLRQAGFGVFKPAALCAGQNADFTPAVGVAFRVFTQKLSYRFHFDAEEAASASSGGPIRKISVELPAESESLVLPAGS
jgi:hypothetical protein